MTPNECAELFVKTMEELNAVALLQMQGILSVVTAGLDTVKTIGSTTPDPAAVDKFEELLKDLKAAIEKIGQEGKNISAPASKSDNFCAEVEDNINMAMKNSLNNQMQLNVMSEAALAQTLALLIAVAKREPQA